MTKSEKTTLIDKLKGNIYVIIFILLAIVATTTIYFSIKALQPTAPVIIAKDNIRVGAVIDKKDLTIQHLPKGSIPPSAFTSEKDIIGKTVVNGPIVHGDMIRQEHLSTASSLKALLLSLTPEGWYAIELPAGIGLGLQGLKKGDYIQVYGETFTEEGLSAGIIVPDAIILSVAGHDLGESNHIIAVPKNYVGVIADSLIKGTPLAIALPDAVPEEIFLEKPSPIEDVQAEYEAEEENVEDITDKE